MVFIIAAEPCRTRCQSMDTSCPGSQIFPMIPWLRFPLFYFISPLEQPCQKAEGCCRGRFAQLVQAYYIYHSKIRLDCVGMFFSVASKQNYKYPSGGKKEKLIGVCSETGRFELLFTDIQRGNQI